MIKVLVCGGRKFGVLPENPTKEDELATKNEVEKLNDFLSVLGFKGIWTDLG